MSTQKNNDNCERQLSISQHYECEYSASSVWFSFYLRFNRNSLLLTYSNLTVIKMAAVRHLGLLGIQFLTAHTVLKVNMA